MPDLDGTLEYSMVFESTLLCTIVNSASLYKSNAMRDRSIAYDRYNEGPKKRKN
jgi:hypothetical protein